MTLSVLEAAAEAPDRPALVIAGHAVSFRELGARVAERGRTLPDPPPNRGPVALVGASDRGTLEALYAFIELGRPVALLHPRWTDAERAAVLEQTGLELIDVGSPVPARRAAAALPEPVEAEAPLAVVFTSGTEGRPKGVVLSRRAFLASARASEANLGWRDDDRWLLGLPVAHVGGLSILTRCLVARRTVVVPASVAEGSHLDGESLARCIQDDGVTLLSVVPTQLEWLLDAGFRAPPHLRAVLVGGAAAGPELLDRARQRGVPVLATYGLTEACSQVATERPGVPSGDDPGVGPPLGGIDVKLVNGAIAVRGRTLLSGYLGSRTAGGADLVDPRDAEGYFVTDDLGRLDDAGRLHVLGRRSELIVTGGENVAPREVEAILERCPGVSAACVFGVPDATWGELVAAALVGSTDGPPDDATLADYVRTSLAPHRRPRLIATVTAFAETGAGKLDRRRTGEGLRGELRRLPGL